MAFFVQGSLEEHAPHFYFTQKKITVIQKKGFIIYYLSYKCNIPKTNILTTNKHQLKGSINNSRCQNDRLHEMNVSDVL